MPETKGKAKPENRRVAKRSAVAQQPKGALRLYVADQCLDVIRVQDVSPFGACVQLADVIAEDAPVRMTYTAAGTDVGVSGTVIWRKAAKARAKDKAQAHACWCGIFLHPGNVDANLRFYRTIIGTP